MDAKQRPENEPTPEELEEVRKIEERRVMERPDVPDEVKAEIMEELEERREADLEKERGE